MKILILTIGTRGDVQPYVALGRALMASGHEITICTCAHFEPFVREYGLGYATLGSICRAIDTVMHDMTMQENAASFGRRLRKENGTSNAVAFITQWMNEK